MIAHRDRRRPLPLSNGLRTNTEDVAKKILTVMHLPTDIPELHPARPAASAARER